ncbi:hypothetical protein [Nocardioides sp.]|uniref:hypothetical protein n=1 Tax=Nocardioides sp. TaxID=35761 RepID=UPI002618FE0F|nr:hypothetical protein [Nocardioides sp.]MDI6910451.1 hypothetical protein [Nocardioides sp.]
MAVVSYAAFANRDPSSGAGTRAKPPSSEPIATPTSSPSLDAAEPGAFARQVATALFAWDTRTTSTPQSVTEQLVAVADPTGESSAGLVSDVANYLPTDQVWIELRKYETRQWIEVGSVEIPDLWATAEAQAGDELLPGTTAFTIRGTRHREGVWEGEDVASQHGVAFTVFIVCAPTYPECHLLRLSKLDDPLE